MKTFLFSLLLFITSLDAFTQSTNLDIAFGTNGIATTQIGISSVIRGMATQSDKKIVVAGSVNDSDGNAFAIVRYNCNGTMDSSFNSTGKVVTHFGSQSEAFSVSIQNDGKIIAAGYMFNDSTWEFGLCRYNSDGSPDNTFGNNGKVHTAIGIIDDEINSICVQSDGKIVAVGYSNSALNTNDYTPEVAVVRYNTDGTLDNSFSGDGKLTTSYGVYDVANSIAIQADGKIVVGGTHLEVSDYQFLVIRYNADGTLDTNFNTDGKMLTTMGSYYDVVHSIAIQDDGKIIACGTSALGNNWDSYAIAVARYTSFGDLDNTFNGDGKVVTALGAFFDISPAVSLQNNGIIVTAGMSNDGVTHDVALIKYNNNGLLDTTFNGNGTLLTNINVNYNVYSIKQSGSQIYVAGSSDQFLVAAFQTINSTLPINVVSLTATLQAKTTTKLKWSITEINTALFEIERSNEGRNFTSIGNVPSAANNSNQKVYTYIDMHPVLNVNFYRLKLVEANGTFNYTNVVKVKFDNTEIRVFPNPTTNFIQVQMPSSSNENIALQIWDMSGKILKKKNSISNGMLQSTTIDVSSLQKGGYILAIKSSAGIQKHLFVKQ